MANIRKLTIRTSALCGLLTLTACEKELDFEYRDIDPITVIEASLTAEGANVRITETTPMDEPMDRTAVTDATVTLTDCDSGDTQRLHLSGNGTYTAGTPGTYGHTYTLTVERPAGKYISSSTMGYPTEIIGMEFNWIKMPYDHVAVLQVSLRDNPEEDGECYWIRLYRNGEAYMWSTVRDNVAVSGRIDEVLMTSRMDTDEEDEKDVLVDGDVVTATVAPVSREMYDYLEALGNDSNSSAMFKGDFCLGYFLAAPVSIASIVFHPDEIPYY